MFILGILIYFLLYSVTAILKFQWWIEATPSSIGRETCENDYANKIIQNIRVHSLLRLGFP